VGRSQSGISSAPITEPLDQSRWQGESCRIVLDAVQPTFSRQLQDILDRMPNAVPATKKSPWTQTSQRRGSQGGTANPGLHSLHSLDSYASKNEGQGMTWDITQHTLSIPTIQGRAGT
jgi:hypothetical protein